MKFEYDILINYSDTDNSKEGSNELGWVENFQRFLGLMLFQIMGRKPTILIKSDKDHIGQDEMAASCLLVNIFSENFVESGNCLDTLNTFINGISGASNVEEQRIYKVLKSPLDYLQQPESVRDLLSYDLYETDIESGEGTEFFDYFGPEAEKYYWMKMVDLAYDISESIITYQEEASSAEVKPLYSRKAIYLAETSHDLVVQRNIIRRELQRHGYRVLPSRALPKEVEAFEKTVENNLKQCDISIHLIGSSYGELLPGADRSIVDIQNKIASELSGELTRDKSDDQFSRFIWISPNLKSVSDKQLAFIENLKRDIASLEVAEILETPLEDFKNIVRQELSESRMLTGDKPKLTTSEDQNSVYLIYDQLDKENAQPLAKFIEKCGYHVIHPQFDHELLVARQHHIDRLVNFDVAMIFKDRVNDQWVRMKVLDLLKAPGFGRRKPVLGRAIVTGPGVKINTELFSEHEVEIIESEDNKLAQDTIKDFLENSHKVL
jgi:hypothetical protein